MQIFSIGVLLRKTPSSKGNSGIHAAREGGKMAGQGG